MSARATAEHRILTALPNCQYNNYAPFDRPHTAPPPPLIICHILGAGRARYLWEELKSFVS